VIQPPARFADFVAYEAFAVDGIKTACFATESKPFDAVSYAASSDPDVMYYHEAMKAPDRADFVRAMEKEMQAHTENRNWQVVLRSSIPRGQMVLPAVWAMRRK
jgi:hypothetical protein